MPTIASTAAVFRHAAVARAVQQQVDQDHGQHRQPDQRLPVLAVGALREPLLQPFRQRTVMSVPGDMHRELVE